jgi:hypothetical protein
MSLRRRILLSALSGASVWPVSFALDAAGLSSEWWGYVSTGVAFGALVLVPFLPARRGRIASVIALLAGSILSYALVVELALEGYGPANLDEYASIVVSGLLGAVPLAP